MDAKIQSAISIVNVECEICNKPFSTEKSRNYHRRIHNPAYMEPLRKKLSAKQMNTGNSIWAGEKVGYNAIHAWVRRKIEKPKNCQNCGLENPSLDLAYKDMKASPKKGFYSRDFSMWIWLCRSCHMKLDGRMKNLDSNGKHWTLKKPRKKRMLSHYKKRGG